MIVLNSAAESLYVRLSGAATTNACQWAVSWTDAQPTRGALVTQDASARGLTTGNTAVALCAGIGTGQRTVNSFTLWNADTVSTTFWFLVGTDPTDSSTSSQLCKFTLLTLETLTYEAGEGFRCYDVNGATKAGNSSDSQAASTAQSVAVLGSSQAASLAAAIVPASVNSVSVKASSMAALVPASVSSQASSMAALGPASVASSLASVSVQQSGASAQSFTSTNWSTASSAVSRLKASFTW